VKIPIAKIYDRVPQRPPGYLDDCIRHGVIKDGWIHFEDDDWRFLCRKYRMLDPVRADLAVDYDSATLAARTRGFEIVLEEVYKRRVAVCEACEFDAIESCRVCGNNPVRLYWRHARCQRGKW